MPEKSEKSENAYSAPGPTSKYFLPVLKAINEAENQTLQEWAYALVRSPVTILLSL